MANRSTYLAPAHTIALILAGGRGSRLYELTDAQNRPSISAATTDLLTLHFQTASIRAFVGLLWPRSTSPIAC